MNISADNLDLLGRFGIDILAMLMLVGVLYRSQQSVPSMPLVLSALNFGLFGALAAITAGTFNAIGLDISPLTGAAVRSKLAELAQASGGRAFFVARADELEGVYDQIEESERSTFNRYTAGSKSDPDIWSPNWNRTFEHGCGNVDEISRVRP